MLLSVSGCSSPSTLFVVPITRSSSSSVAFKTAISCYARDLKRLAIDFPSNLEAFMILVTSPHLDRLIIDPRETPYFSASNG